MLLVGLFVAASSGLVACRMTDRATSSIKAGGDTCTSPAPKLPSLHRLSNHEYVQTVRDLLGTKQSFISEFPPDVRSNGFDNAADAHSVSTTIVEKYLDVANRLAKEHANRLSVTCKEDASCYDDQLLKISEKAFRRTFVPGESDRLKNTASSIRTGGAIPREAYQQSLAAVLISPQFLFRVNGAKQQIDRQDQYELASRLSYFLWTSMPDDTLLNQVKSGALSSSESLRKTILDMAKNAKAIGLVRNFTRQWLGHQDLLLRNPTPPLDADIMKDFETEALSFVSEFLRSNRSVKELLGSDFTFINGRLAKLYDITGDGVDFKRTNPSMQRNLGVLSQGAFLVATSNPSSTSPVRRGHWILENLLCEPPPPSPPNVDFGTFQSAGDNLSAREKLQQHTTNPSCAACHAKIDSIGLAFENYDHFGVWRDSETAGKIITDGKLPE